VWFLKGVSDAEGALDDIAPFGKDPVVGALLGKQCPNGEGLLKILLFLFILNGEIADAGEIACGCEMLFLSGQCERLNRDGFWGVYFWNGLSNRD
jgi:hypothetical protein